MPPPSTVGPLPIEGLKDLVMEYFAKTSRKVRIDSVEWKYLTEPGENFGSLIFAVNIGISGESGGGGGGGGAEELNLVVKLPPKSAYLQDLFNSPVTFDKELRFYRDVVPALETLQIERGLGVEKVAKISAKFFAGRLGMRAPLEFDEQAAIVLENLSHGGYSTRDRLSGLDERHAALAVKTLATLHAVTISLKHERPDVFAGTVLPALRSYVNETAAACLEDMITKARADLRAIEELGDCIDAVEKTLAHAAGARAPSEGESPWKTLLHNDFWVNNMMFRYGEDGRHPVDMKIVDFQLSLYDYGVKDLLFFLMSSVEKSVVDQHLDDMIDLYYRSFIETLRSLNIDTERFGRGEFFTLLRSCAPIKFEQCIFMTQVIQATRRERDSSGGKEHGDETPSFLSSTGEPYREKLLHIVRTFERRGWLVK